MNHECVFLDDFKNRVLEVKKKLIKQHGSEKSYFEYANKLTKEHVESIKRKWGSNFIKKILFKRKKFKNFKIEGFTVKEPKFKDVRKDKDLNEGKKWLENNDPVRLIPLMKNGNVVEPFVVLPLVVLEDFLCVGIVESVMEHSDKHDIEYRDLVLFYPKNVYDKMTMDLNLIAYAKLIRSTKVDMCEECFKKFTDEGFFKPIKLYF